MADEAAFKAEYGAESEKIKRIQRRGALNEMIGTSVLTGRGCSEEET